MYVKIWTKDLVERLRKIIGFRGTYLDPPLAMPVVMVNDGKEVQVKSANAERSATGTATILATPSGRTETYITGFTLTASELVVA